MTPLPREKPDFRARLHEAPHKPGVYLMRDRLNRVIYVGKARDLRKRLSQYFMPSRQMTADPKTRALLDSIWEFEWHTVNSEPEAMLLEGRLIKEYRPRYNVSFRDDKRFLLVKVDPRDQWPRFRLTRLRGDEGARYFGPFAHSGALRQTMAFLRKKFGVLTFGRGNPTERELKSSTYQVPMKLADITTEQYRVRIEAACEFLDGRSRELLNILPDLRRTTAPSRKFTRSLDRMVPSTVNPEADMLALKDALQLAGPPRHMECFDISNISTTHIVASMVCFKEGAPDRASYRRYRISSVEGQNDFASMAEVVRRRYARVLRESDAQRAAQAAKANETEAPFVDVSGDYSQESPIEKVARVAESQADSSLGFAAVRLPDLIIVDGGKGQLSSACKELQRLGLHEVPIIGLAKEFEEIYRPGRPAPLLLPEDSGALRLLQRIRDEAHRFANTFHQLLMKRRVAESILDDCPGVSQHRKELLLREFGSVARLRRASREEIAAVTGIGPRLAEQITAYLAERK